MQTFLSFLREAAVLGGYVWVWVMCAAGVVLSCLSISGTWLVVLGALIAALLSGQAFPGLWTVLLFVGVATVVEVAEALAGVWGVKKRGGSSWAGFAALAGGLAGMFLGALLPVPLLGSLAGMTAGSFALVYVVERARLRRSAPALHVAAGAVLARVAVVLLKVTATLGMIAWLAIGMIVQ